MRGLRERSRANWLEAISNASDIIAIWRKPSRSSGTASWPAGAVCAIAGLARDAINAPRATNFFMELLLFQVAAPRHDAETGLRDHELLLHRSTRNDLSGSTRSRVEFRAGIVRLGPADMRKASPLIRNHDDSDRRSCEYRRSRRGV